MDLVAQAAAQAAERTARWLDPDSMATALMDPRLGQKLLLARAAEEVEFEEAKEEIRREREATGEAAPLARARGKLSPAALAEHLSDIPRDKVHPDGRHFSVNDRRKALASKGIEISRSQLTKRLNASK